MNEFPKNLWAPWRMDYIHGLAERSRSGCFLCDYRDDTAGDAANHVLWRADDMMVVMNRFPYTNGHLMIAPTAHRADLDDLDDRQLCSLIRHTRDAKRLLADIVAAQGFNVGINFGLCAGAGLPDHVHVHVVPRWNGDTNFMAVLGDVRVVPESIDRLYAKLRDRAAQTGLPRPAGA